MRSPLATLIRSLVLAAAIWIVGTLVACAPASGVWSDGDAIHYRGELSEELNDRVYALYDAPALKPTRLVIQSGGGNVELGLDLGEFIIDEQLDVSVPKYCISSCANYVFTAGRRKLLGKHALVGFHGGATSPGLLDRSLAELRADPPPGLSDVEIAELERGLIDYFTEWQAREAAFFDRIGVDASITVFAQADSPAQLSVLSRLLDLQRRRPRALRRSRRRGRVAAARAEAGRA